MIEIAQPARNQQRLRSFFPSADPAAEQTQKRQQLKHHTWSRHHKKKQSLPQHADSTESAARRENANSAACQHNTGAPAHTHIPLVTAWYRANKQHFPRHRGRQARRGQDNDPHALRGLCTNQFAFCPQQAQFFAPLQRATTKNALLHENVCFSSLAVAHNRKRPSRKTSQPLRRFAAAKKQQAQRTKKRSKHTRTDGVHG